MANLAEIAPPPTSDDAFADLVAELEHFRHCITDTAAVALAGVMLQDGGRPAVPGPLPRAPRRSSARPAARLPPARHRRGHLDSDADLAVAGSLLTGSWYAFAISGADVPDDWAHRVADLTWRACGGSRGPR